jgi:hypothetical protein
MDRGDVSSRAEGLEVRILGIGFCDSGLGIGV